MNIISLSAILLLASQCHVLAVVQPVAPSPQKVMKQCERMYAGLKSYTETADVTVHSPSGVAQQRVKVIVMKPNYLFISVKAEGGVREICSNGKQFTVYVPSVNRYTLSKTAPTLAGVLSLLSTHAQMGTIFNGLFFTAGEVLPPNLAQIKLVRTKQLRGQEYATISAMVPASKSKAHVKSVDVKWTWFINLNTNQIVRTDALSSPFSITMPVLSKSKGKMVGHSVLMHVEVHSSVVKSALNPPLSLSAFVIHMKPGAQRVGSLSKGG